MGHATPALLGLAGRHGHKCVLLLEAILFGMVSMGVFRQRVTRVVGVVPIPTLTTGRKLAMHLFCGGKKGVDHDVIGMGWGCRFCLLANGIGSFE
jgi:hypothetical protein